MREAVALSAEDDGELWLSHERLILNGDGIVRQRHRRRAEAERAQPRDPPLRPIARRIADVCPRHLEHRPHADADRAAAERVAAGRRRQNGIHAERRRRTEERADIRRIRDALQHGHAPCPGADRLRVRQLWAAHRAEHAARQRIAREARKHLTLRRVGRNVREPGQQRCRVSRRVPPLHQERKRLIAVFHGGRDNLRALRDEHALLRLEPAAELRLGQAREDIQLRRGDVVDLNEHVTFLIPSARRADRGQAGS